MADLPSLLAVLEQHPDDVQALEALKGAAKHAAPDVRATRLDQARKALAAKGRPDVAVALFDIELAVAEDANRRGDLLLEKGMVLNDDLLDVPGARQAFDEALAIRPDDSMAREALDDLDVAASNWQKFAEKYIKEAGASTDRTLATSLYVSAAEAYVRFAPESTEAEGYLRKALEIEGRNSKAAFHLARLLRRQQRWADLTALLEQRAELAPSVEEKVSALLALAEIARAHLADAGGAARADRAIERVLVLDPAQPQALRQLAEAHMAAGDWLALVGLYQNALKAGRRDREGEDLGILLQIAMVLWKHVGDLDQAEEYFRRIRKLEPAHPAALDFYRVYYPQRGENQKLLALLRQVEKSPRARTESGGQRPLGVEIAELAEAQNNPEKAIEAWKQHLRQDPSSQPARTALARLYRKTDKWNALLDLMKEEIERLPESDVAGRVEKLHEIVEIYRDKLRLDVMVINTYNAILKIDPDNRRATDELAAKFRALGRWNDLIAVLTRKSEAADLPVEDRIPLLREIADLWAERFGNFANAIRPLERILELDPADETSLLRLKEIYTKRRQWRALIDVLAREASVLSPDEKRVKQAEMARLAAERLGDTRLAIEIFNSILMEVGPDHAETIASLASLYEREKRWLGLAEILHRQIAALRASQQPSHAPIIALYEKLGQVYVDRLGAPQEAAKVWQEVLDLEPHHAKALRTLRELYATAGDFAGLEALYARLGQEDELVDALISIADRLEHKAQRLPLVERAAQLAQQRAEAAASGTVVSEGRASRTRRSAGGAPQDAATAALERARQVWERVLAVEPHHIGAAHALAPIYAKQEKWAKLVTLLEIELSAAPDVPARLAKMGEIRQICEQKLTSRTLAFAWTLRAFDLDPESEQLFADVLRLASEAEQWREVAAMFEKHAVASGATATKVRLYRELSKIATRRLGDLERARGYHRQVLALEPHDRDAEAQLEELATQLADWPELLASYRRRANREQDAVEKATLLVEIATLQEEKLVDLDGAATTYRETLQVAPGNQRALRSLAKIEEARGDWEGLAGVLAMELQQTTDPQARFDLLMRLGALEEQALERFEEALAYYRDALGVPGPRGEIRQPALVAVARYLPSAGPGAKVAPSSRVAAARLILPHLEASHNLIQQAIALEVIRTNEATTAEERLEIDRQLMRLYHTDLGDPASAWAAGLRIFAVDPTDRDVRSALGVLAGQLGRDGEWANHLGAGLANVRSSGSSPVELRAMATELAQVAADRLGDRTTAERAWLTVLEVEADAPDAFDALADFYRADERWTDLRALLERRADLTNDDRIRMEAVLELAELEERVLREPGRAAAAHRRLLELEPTYLPSFQALDRLYSASQQWPELEDLLARASDVVDARTRDQLMYRRAELFAHRLGDPVRAVDLLEDVISRQPAYLEARALLEELLPQPAIAQRVARILEPLYESDLQWGELVTVLRAQRAAATGTEAVELLSRIAMIEENQLEGASRAFEAWAEILALDPTHERARTELARLAQQLGRWVEATAALERAADAAPEEDTVTRAALLGELATYYDTQLGDSPRAIASYRRLLATDASSPATVRKAAAALARLYDQSAEWSELRGVMKKQAEWAEDTNERRALLARVAALEEEQLRDKPAAISTWRDILADSPVDPSALNALERLYQATEQWRDLIDVLRRKLDHADEAESRELLGRVAIIHEAMLEEPEEAIAAYLEVVDRTAASGVPDAHALTELARLYRASERHADLLDVLERQATLVDDARRLDLQIEIARLLAGPLARPVEALERWKAILEENPLHSDATSAVEAALGDPDLRVLAADILRPVYDATSQHERLAGLQLRASEWADDPATKLRALNEVVRIREHRLGDKAGAFAVQLLALHQAATEPELPQAVAETERLAGELGREADLIDAYIGVAPNVLDAEIQRRLYLDIADLSRAVRRDHELAREYYQKVLDAVPDDRRSLMALEAIYRDTNDDVRLTEVLLRQADTAGVDVEDRVMALVEAAGLYVTQRRPDDAISTWEQVLAIAPERRDAVDALEALYREQGRWPDVVDLYERRLGFATSVEEAVGLRVHIGEIHEHQLRDFETAIDNYSAALSGDSHNQVALVAVERFLGDPDLRVVAAEVLEPIYVSQQRWHDLIRVYDARLESASDPVDRLRLTKFVARLYEEQLEDFENASRWYAKVFRESPSDPSIRDQLHRLGTVVENWGFVAETYQAYLDEETGESPEIRDVAVAAATIYDRRLGDVERAAAAYRRALAIQIDGAAPDERELLRRTEELLGRAGKYAELVAVYDEVIARADDELRLEALIKRARLLEQGLGDAARAIEGWREVVLTTEGGDSPLAYRDAVVELERLYRERSEWRALVELFEARLTHTEHPTEIAELRLKLAETFEHQLGDIAAAIDQYEQIIDEGVQWKQAVTALEMLVVHDEHRERIAALLEPVYRQEDWWEKLVVILDAKLEFVRDPIEQVTTLHEIASIHEDRGGDLELALAALARAWRTDVADEESLRKLLALAGRLAAWDEAVGTLEEGAHSAGTGELAAGLWARAAEIHEARRNDLPRSIDAWRKVEESHPDDIAALAALDRLLALTNRVEELVVVIARRADLTEDPEARLVLLHRVAATYEDTLVDKPRAIEAYKAVLGADDADMEALDALERLYTETDDGRELAQILERKIELCADLAARQELRFAAAKVYEEKLSDIYQSLGQLTAAHDDDASDPRALAELDRVYEREKMWAELLDIIDKRTALAAEPEQAELAFRGAQLVEQQLGDPEAAIPRHGNVLQLAPSHAGARQALEQLMVADDNVDAATAILEQVYRADREAAGLVRVYERRLAVDPARTSTATDRRSDWAALADVYETLAGQPAQAFGVWSRAIAATPEDVELLAPLIRLAEGDPSGGLWRDLAVRLDQLLEASLSIDVEQAYAMKLGQIAEDRLGDLDRAARAYERATGGADPTEALLALERVLARSSRWADLAGVLRRQADVAETDEQTTEYLMKLGQLQEITLGDPRSAVAVYREVLDIDSAHPGARAALERMLASAPEQRAELVEILEPLFERDSDAPRLVKVLEARLEHTRDPIDRASLLGRLVELNEGQLGDLGGALDAALRWLADDPASMQALGEIDRLGERVNQWPEVSSRMAAIVSAPGAEHRDPAVQVALHVFLGRILRERLQQLEPAARSYRAALAIEPDSLGALDPLIEILRRSQDDHALAEALRQRGRIVTEPAERRAAFAEVATICERGGDRPAAIAAWREVADHDDNDREALDELAALYRITGDKQDLIDTLSRAARLAPSSDDEKQLRIEIAQLEGEGPRAVSAWQAVVDLDGDDLAAMGHLEQALARAGEWNAVADLQMRRLSLATTTDERIAIQSQIARIAEDKRGSVDDAVLGWYAVLDIDNAHEPAYAELERLLRSAARWHDVVDLLERRAELEAARGNAAAELAALARAADTWEKELDNPDAAGEILEKILERDPTSVAALTRLSKIHERAGDWDRCKATLEQALRLSPTGRDAADLFFRLGEVARVGDSDVDTAAQHFLQALKHDGAHEGAVAAMEKIARDRKDGALLSDMLQRRVQVVTAPAERVTLYVEIAELERRANRIDAALAALAKAAEDAPGDARVMGPLADLYFATGRLDEAAPIYDRLAEEAKAGRRMKEVARYRQRQGSILEARGDRAGALAAYEEALRVNPSDITTMTGLGRLYFESQDWEKARRIYQSLVLAKFDTDIGVTKGEVYWALGNIHLRLGQPPKAKSMFQRGLEEEPGNQRLKEALSSLS